MGVGRGTARACARHISKVWLVAAGFGCAVAAVIGLSVTGANAVATGAAQRHEAVAVAVAAAPTPSQARKTLGDGTVVILGPGGATVAVIAPAVVLSPRQPPPLSAGSAVLIDGVPASPAGRSPAPQTSDSGTAVGVIAGVTALACGGLVALLLGRRRSRHPASARRR